MSRTAASRRRATLRSRGRSAGLLLHPTSLPGPFAVGDLGPAAHDLLDWLVEAGLSSWQVLPLGPTGFADSPYTALSSFAGNPVLISPQALAADGLLDANELDAATRQSPADAGRADLGGMAELKEGLHRRAWRRFRAGASSGLAADWDAFRADSSGASWLDDWCLYRALKSRHGGASWLDWNPPLRDRLPGALDRARTELAEEIEFRRFEQFLFERQWSALRAAAETRGIQLIGDLPFYPALDSADVWAGRQLFKLGPDGRPLVVAGVPPDYFSSTGQLWGNPVYDWKRLEEDGYRWWIDRVAGQMRRVHLLRLDHFRGFVSYWEVPGAASLASAGRWRRGPGRRLFRHLRDQLGELPLLVEDLGDIDARVHALRRHLGLPGTRVLQFGFDEVDSLHAPHRIPVDVVVYSGTHDNDTCRGWAASVEATTLQRALDYLGTTIEDLPDAMVGAALASAAGTAILPLQDLLGLGSEARMNFPGARSGNWTWRVDSKLIPADLPHRLRRRVEATARLRAVASDEDDLAAG